MNVPVMALEVVFYKADEGRLCGWQAAPPKRRRAHRDDLDGIERLVNAHVTAWRKGAVTPAAPALESMLARWRALRGGEELCLVWRTRPNER